MASASRQAWAVAIADAGAGGVGALLNTRVPGWMADAGWTAGAIGLALAASRLVRVAVIPAILHAISADRRVGKGAMAISLAAALSLLLPFAGAAKWGWLGVELIAPALVAALMAQLDWLSSGGAAPSRLNPQTYGTRRAIGSAAFATAAIGCGLVTGAAAAPTLMTAASAILILSGVAIGHGFGNRVHAAQPMPVPGPQDARTGRVAGLVIAIVMIQASNGLYSLTPLLWAQQGRGPAEIGLLWAVAAVSEIGFFLVAPWLCRRIADWPRALLLLGGAGAATRWLIIASATSLPVLLFAQTLQSFSFGASLIGTLALIRNTLTGREHARAVGINQGFQTGLIPAISLGASGFLLQALGQRSFLIMAAIATIGVIAALDNGRYLRWTR